MSNKCNRWFAGIGGVLMLLFGMLCLNHTKMGSTERHARFARQRGWPEPSRGILYAGMVPGSLGGCMIGFAMGRKQALAAQPGRPPRRAGGPFQQPDSSPAVSR
jgi:hypothetical protein